MDTELDRDCIMLTDSGAVWRSVLLSILVHLLLVSLFLFYGSSLALHPRGFTEEKYMLVALNSLATPGRSSAAFGDGGSPGDNAERPHSEKPLAVASTPPIKQPDASHHQVSQKHIKPKSAAIKPVSVASRPLTMTKPPETQTSSEIAQTPSAPEAEEATSAVASATSASGNAVAQTDQSSSNIPEGGKTTESSSGSGSGNGAGSGNGTGNDNGNGSGNGRGNGNGSGNGQGPIISTFGSAEGPKFMRQIMPHYPRMAKLEGLEGTVVLLLMLDKNGRIVDIEVISGAGHGFDEAAIEAVRDSTFSPAQKNGIPVACKALFPVRFKLR
ncbi:energy transducer TonB [Desulfatirhabdium butyrativorans]|uniref:energy transducer TonB n=1 Tax=Desulfatirhabdium butyrativorans TaxID=340467 RepID=UPI00040B0C1D|nr:energy transducer TonB [Desulfatirhabdium butyrativorans]